MVASVRRMTAMPIEPAALPEHEPALYAMLRQAGIDAGEALRLTTGAFPRPAPAADPRELQRLRWREHGRLPVARAYTGL